MYFVVLAANDNNGSTERAFYLGFSEIIQSR